ncbi:MAG TPA: DUF2332 family protein, partial [Phenylobacterium sp.]
MTGLTLLSRTFEAQAGFCERLGSPFNAVLARRISEALAAGDDLEGLLAPWMGMPREALADTAVTLRLLGAFHDLALSGEAPELAAAYPSAQFAGAPDEAWRLGRAAMKSQRSRFAEFISHEPQTNEVRRSCVLLGGFLTIAEATRAPLRCFELGASAGLNLNWDSFGYRLGGHAWGDPAAAVQLANEWR